MVPRDLGIAWPVISLDQSAAFCAPAFRARTLRFEMSAALLAITTRQRMINTLLVLVTVPDNCTILERTHLRKVRDLTPCLELAFCCQSCASMQEIIQSISFQPLYSVAW